MVLLPDRVQTERLVLRHWTAADAPALSAAVEASLDHLRPWMWWAALEPVTPEVRIETIESFERDYLAGGDAVYGVFLDGVAIGGSGLHRRRGPGVLEIGYWIHVGHLCRGYATELAAALTSASFEVPGIGRVEIHHDRANRASRRIPERLGFTLLAEQPDGARAPGEEGVDCTWSMDPATWTDLPGR
jgi:RimJ/RimL family protein N-acetyltransferase